LTRALDSRELKLILDPLRFQDPIVDIRKFQKMIKAETDMLDGKFKQEDNLDPRYRRTYYLDTDDFKLKAKSFFLRIREELEGEKKSKYDVTLKCRHPDRYISGAFDLSDPSKHRVKFEEDIIAPYISKFSLSSKYDDDKEPEIQDIKGLERKFPGLGKHDIENGKLHKVNDFEAEEVSYKVGKIRFADKDDENEERVKIFLNFWYSPNEKRLPLVAEFTFDYDANNRGTSLMEEFPLSLVSKSYEFYHALQDRRIVSLDSSKTKTSFAYQYRG
jgi:hypothetical protein